MVENFEDRNKVDRYIEEFFCQKSFQQFFWSYVGLLFYYLFPQTKKYAKTYGHTIRFIITQW